jgi:hypothetical protein
MPFLLRRKQQLFFISILKTPYSFPFLCSSDRLLPVYPEGINNYEQSRLPTTDQERTGYPHPL